MSLNRRKILSFLIIITVAAVLMSCVKLFQGNVNMMQKLLIPNVWKDDTVYVGDQQIYHVRPQDGAPYDMHFRKDGGVVKTGVLLEDKRNVTLDFNGATLMLHGKMQPFVINRCHGVTIRNVTIVHDRASFTEATVMERGDGFIRIKLNPHHPCRVEDGKLIPTSEYWENLDLDRINMFMQCFDAETRDGIGAPLCMIGKTIHRDPSFPFTVHQYVAEDEGDGVIKLSGPMHDCFKIGCIIAIGHERRNYSTIFMYESSDVRLENVRVINGPGMGILPIHTKNIYLDKVRFMYDHESQGIITNQADAVHAFACSGDFSFTDCVFEGMIDDAINIHSQFYLLEKMDGNHITLKHTELGETTANTIFAAGDRIGIHRNKTTDIEAEYKIVEKTILDDEFIDLLLDRPVAAHAIGSLVENLSAQANITMRNCVFRKSNSHLRFQSSGRILIENCEIGLPVLLTGDGAFWFESSGVRDMTIRDTAFTTPKASIRITPQIFPTEKEPYYHKNITVTHCRFKTGCPIEGRLADNIRFQDNIQTDGKPMVLKLTNCGRVEAENCAVERHTEKIESIGVN